MRLVRCLAIGLLCSGLLSSSAAAEPVSFSSSLIDSAIWTANGHRYAVQAADEITWDEARAAAASLSLPGPGTWHLATITSAAEQAFVESLSLPGNEYWLGGLQNPLFTDVPDQNWTWITGEAFAYTNWSSANLQEPNDFYGPGTEPYLGILGASASGLVAPYGGWNDEGFPGNIAGFVVENPAPVPEPLPIGLVLLGLGYVRLYVRSRGGTPPARSAGRPPQ